jgi:uncharacterized protein YbjQ (UPF0145 family)
MPDPSDPQPERTVPVEDAMVTTALELPNHDIVRNVGIVRGITVRSRSVLGNVFGILQSTFGGNITIFTELAERARRQTYDDMRRNAGELGANAVVGMHYDTMVLLPGLTEVLCYGTAVVVAPRRG